jgi:hypothetical protein
LTGETFETRHIVLQDAWEREVSAHGLVLLIEKNMHNKCVIIEKDCRFASLVMHGPPEYIR